MTIPSDPDTALTGPAALTRRGFATGLGAGFALAVSPAAAGAITTDENGIVTGVVPVPTTDGLTMAAYHAHPKRGAGAGSGGGAGRAAPHPAPAPCPTVLVVQEIFGVHEHIRDLCRRLAKQGYYAIAPDLYFRQGNPTTVADIPTLISTIVAKVPDAQVMADLDATLETAAKGGLGDVRRAAVTGFCWGGRITWLYAAHNPGLKAGAAWYGKLVGTPDPLHPENPIDVVSRLRVPVQGFYGGQDQGIPLDTVERMRTALAAAGNPSQIQVYADAGHGFNADYRPSYVEADARDAWARMLAWFKAHGAA